MAALNPEHLLELADRTIAPGGQLGAPRQANLRRGISTAYYALFHAICDAVATALSHGNDEAYQILYRAVDHGPARGRCGEVGQDQDADVNLRRFADSFVQLQELRHLADYDPGYRVDRQEASNALRAAKVALQALVDADPTARFVFCASVLARRRR